jgi:hypothetical protein
MGFILNILILYVRGTWFVSKAIITGVVALPIFITLVGLHCLDQRPALVMIIWLTNTTLKLALGAVLKILKGLKACADQATSVLKIIWSSPEAPTKKDKFSLKQFDEEGNLICDRCAGIDLDDAFKERDPGDHMNYHRVLQFLGSQRDWPIDRCRFYKMLDDTRLNEKWHPSSIE